MKTAVLNILLFWVVIGIYSCNDTVNPNAPFRERFILNGIIRNDTSYQVITLSHSYQPGNFDPLSYKTDPAVVDAEVNIYYKNELFHMRDTSIARTDTSHYTTPLHFYYNDQLKPEPNEDIEIDALLPNGLLLQSLTTTPDIRQPGFFDPKSDSLISKQSGAEIEVSWRDLGGNIYAPDIYIAYFLKGDTTEYHKKLPLYYFTNSNGSDEPVYASPSKSNTIYLDKATIEKTLFDIIPEGADTADYSVTKIVIDLSVYDKFISKYYSSIQQGLDNFTVKLDIPDYTNVKGGFGIFGSEFRTSFSIKFDFNYLRSLGFR